MRRKTDRKRWSPADLAALRKYVLSQSRVLLANFYLNVKDGSVLRRKPSRFFIKMANYLQMTPAQCKSKFQKFEREIYTNFLGLPHQAYRVLQHIRRKKASKKLARANQGAFVMKKPQHATARAGESLGESFARVSKDGKRSVIIFAKGESKLSMRLSEQQSYTERELEDLRQRIIQFYTERCEQDPDRVHGKSRKGAAE